MWIKELLYKVINELRIDSKPTARLEKVKLYIAITQKYNFDTNEYKNSKVECFTDPCKAIEFYEKNQPCELVSKELKI